jgi:hypothetical protein
MPIIQWSRLIEQLIFYVSGGLNDILHLAAYMYSSVSFHFRIYAKFSEYTCFLIAEVQQECKELRQRKNEEIILLARRLNTSANHVDL